METAFAHPADRFGFGRKVTCVASTMGHIKIRRAILEIRKEKGLKAAETSTGYLSQIEQGVRYPSLDMLERLAMALGVSVTDLVSTC